MRILDFKKFRWKLCLDFAEKICLRIMREWETRIEKDITKRMDLDGVNILICTNYDSYGI